MRYLWVVIIALAGAAWAAERLDLWQEMVEKAPYFSTSCPGQYTLPDGRVRKCRVEYQIHHQKDSMGVDLVLIRLSGLSLGRRDQPVEIVGLSQLATPEFGQAKDDSDLCHKILATINYFGTVTTLNGISTVPNLVEDGGFDLTIWWQDKDGKHQIRSKGVER